VHAVNSHVLQPSLVTGHEPWVLSSYAVLLQGHLWIPGPCWALIGPQFRFDMISHVCVCAVLATDA
jgi:hypothetical protein